MKSGYFISMDWGTSNLRIRLVQVATLHVLEEVTSSKGIKTIYNEWLVSGCDKEAFYLSFLKEEISTFKTQINVETLVVMSGMGSSSIGLRELPYAELPFHADGKSLYVETIENAGFPYKIQLISGVKSDTDVIRGEEVEMIGLIEEDDALKKTIFITPGTHSKHIICDNKKIIDFHTFMTGEMFSIIANHSILNGSIEKTDISTKTLQAFSEGIIDASKENSVLNTIFIVRTNALFGKKSKEENYYYLSGLLIGEELQTLKNSQSDAIKLCAGGALFELYHKAIEVLGLLPKTTIIPKEIVDAAVVKGQWHIIKNRL
tara:strand:- start:5153 stop:6106 length:954 start_codon:yes stop_codon:yes gene_type:complete